MTKLIGNRLVLLDRGIPALLARARDVVSVGSGLSHCSGTTQRSTWCLVSWWCLLFWLLGTGTIPSPVWDSGTVTSNSFLWDFAFNSFLTSACLLLSDTWGGSRVFCVGLSFPELCLTDSLPYLVLWNSPLLFLNFDSSNHWLNFPAHGLPLGNASRAVSWTVLSYLSRVTVLCFVTSIVLCGFLVSGRT